MDLEYKKYLKKLKFEKFIILFFQIFILISFIITWELLSKFKIINPFIFSSPTKILETVKNLLTILFD